MIIRSHANTGMLHLFSALVACGLVAAILFVGRTIAIHVEQSTLPSTAPELFSLKIRALPSNVPRVGDRACYRFMVAQNWSFLPFQKRPVGSFALHQRVSKFCPWAS